MSRRLIPFNRRAVSLLLLIFASAQLLAASKADSASLRTFRDCANCVLLQVIPAGHFLMGSPENEVGREMAEGPRRSVSIRRAFAIGVYDITVAQYARFVKATGYTPQNPRCDWRNPKFRSTLLSQSADEPVVCVNWLDATAYIRWLSKLTSHTYRLPSEAEWEYAARAGSTTARPWGAYPDPNHANTGADTCCATQTRAGDRWPYTSPVGSFPPNAFGLYDMIGNVWQWTADCGSRGYEKNSASCDTHIVRGGSWFHPPQRARSASRVADGKDLRVVDIGFRVVRDLQ